MSARWEKLSIDGKEVRCYVGVPDHPRPRAGVVIAHHGPGLDETMFDVVHRLNRAGYAAALPDLFHRFAPGTDMMQKIQQLRDEHLIADMNAALAHLKSLAPAVEPFGVTGFCMGGRVTYLMACASREFKAAAVFYGGQILKQWGDSPAPFERSKDISCPVLGFFGAEDTNPSPDDVAKIDAELARLGKWREFHTYRNAGHAFMNFLNPERYRHRAAQSAWPQLVAFFDEYLH